MFRFAIGICSGMIQAMLGMNFLSMTPPTNPYVNTHFLGTLFISFACVTLLMTFWPIGKKQ